ncbi:MAG: 23S rRNA (pseudouridine(1915)-N(3))-methyltransferase RlmH [Acidobacteria bacterium]|nr:23S rRNA (pseudouridine(1915)-N(3))-methyltransferase RlmH [Acidobacteriota bacterium]
MNLKFLWIGKTKNSAVRVLLSDYVERIRHLVPCEIIEARDLSKRQSLRAEKLIEAEGEELARHIPESGRLVALDETGSQFSSRHFAGWLESEQNTGARVMTFVIGGPDGLSRAIRSRASLVLSLGKMTWTHEMCRVLLLEQIYRALCIMRNIPYHKGSNQSE